MSLCSKICLNSSKTEAQSANKDPWLPSIWYVPGIVLTSLITITVSLLISLLFSKLKKKGLNSSTLLKFPKKLKRNFQPTENVIQLILTQVTLGFLSQPLLSMKWFLMLHKWEVLAERRQSLAFLISITDFLFGAQQFDFVRYTYFQFFYFCK